LVATIKKRRSDLLENITSEAAQIDESPPPHILEKWNFGTPVFFDLQNKHDL
jgi:hypothetical protein